MFKTLKWINPLMTNGFVKDILKWQPVRTDHALFNLHYRFSILLIFLATAWYGAAMWEYGVMKCIFASGSGDDKDAACWTLGVYTLRPELAPRVKLAGELRLHPRLHVGTLHNASQWVRYHNYYEWTPYILLLQVLLFYIPRFFWLCFENEKILMLCSYKHEPNPKKFEIISSYNVYKDPKATIKRLKEVAEYFVAHLGYNNVYAMAFAFSELLNFGVVLLQLYLLDAMTGNVFLEYGITALPYVTSNSDKDSELGPDPFQYTFPVKAKCTFNKYGPGGNIIPDSGVCALPMNMVSKIYFFCMWFYLLLLAVMNVLNILYRILLLASPRYRLKLLENEACTTSPIALKYICKQCSYGDWFILRLLCDNLEGPVFRELCDSVVYRIKDLKPNV